MLRRKATTITLTMADVHALDDEARVGQSSQAPSSEPTFPQNISTPFGSSHSPQSFKTSVEDSSLDSSSSSLFSTSANAPATSSGPRSGAAVQRTTRSIINQ
ncbi:uncharacterized protein V1516DRAFT_683859 [Lipomyces oligophaga]|uniref:uncharacterized protein n=1 Tax=Lipomyces oligophaga TaxID=45792 RepID=UPI0034CEE611